MAPTRIYLDANATTPSLPEVCAAVDEAHKLAWGNPASQHAEGRAARRRLDRARAAVAALVGVPEAWVTFTSGASEAINTVLQGVTPETKVDAPPWVVTTPVEHPAVRTTLAMLAEQGRVRVRELPTDLLGRVHPDDLADAFAALAPAPVALAAVIAAHNETGGLQDVPALAEVCRQHAVPLLADGVQWTGKLSAHVETWGVDAWPISAHKFGGPKGVGALAARPGLVARPLIAGGPQERRRRAGTVNVPGAAGLGCAAELAAAELPMRIETWRHWADAFARRLVDVWPGAELIGDPQTQLPQTLLVRFPGWAGVELTQRLDLDGFAVGTGSACSSGAVRASDALLAGGWARDAAAELVRISLPPRLPDANRTPTRLLEALAAIYADTASAHAGA